MTDGGGRVEEEPCSEHVVGGTGGKEEREGRRQGRGERGGGRREEGGGRREEGEGKEEMEREGRG